jgi:histidine triad (HIT) family protein
MPSIFTRIVNGEIPCYKVAETEDFLAFLDITPRVKGHTLCIPKKEIDYIFDMEDAPLGALMAFSKKVAKAIEAVIPCQRVGIAVIGLEVPHAHIHLFPMNTMADFGFGHPAISIPADEMQALAVAVSESFYQQTK